MSNQIKASPKDKSIIISNKLEYRELSRNTFSNKKEGKTLQLYRSLTAKK